MRVNLNGNLFLDNSAEDQLFRMIDKNSYNGLGDAISSKLTVAIQNTEWYHHTPDRMDMLHNLDHVNAVCGGKVGCWEDSAIWTLMKNNEVTADIYKFITDRTAVMRAGLQDNLIPNHHLDFGGIFNLIDWHFILDCISWFF